MSRSRFTEQTSTFGTTLECPLCGGPLVRIHSSWPGYIEPKHYSILECRRCLSHQALPRAVDPSIYDMIYRVADRIPGYHRYAALTRLVQRHPNKALDFLAQREDGCWGIRNALAQCRISQGARVLDVGCGLGYLTFALRMTGFDAAGIELSQNVVDRAIQLFGPHYEVSSLEQISDRRPNGFDVVILAETLEHVEDPVETLRLAKQCLRPGGIIIVTTPNRSFFPESAIWQTDAPPVHLWWFSEPSILALANRLNLRVVFTDFIPLARLKPLPIPHPGEELSASSRLDAQGNVLIPERALTRFLIATNTFDLAWAFRHRLLRFTRLFRKSPSPKVNLGNRPTMCVTFSAAKERDFSPDLS